METFERETITQLARLGEQNRSMMRSLDEMRQELQRNNERMRKLEFANQYRHGVVAVIALLGSAAGGCAVVLLQWILSVKL
jgi:hypothetical protein